MFMPSVAIESRPANMYLLDNTAYRDFDWTFVSALTRFRVSLAPFAASRTSALGPTRREGRCQPIGGSLGVSRQGQALADPLPNGLKMQKKRETGYRSGRGRLPPVGAPSRLPAPTTARGVHARPHASGRTDPSRQHVGRPRQARGRPAASLQGFGRGRGVKRRTRPTSLQRTLVASNSAA
jgi:hypothetical protein